MSIAATIAEILAEALPVAVGLASRAARGEDVEVEAAQHAANLTYKLSSQQVHLRRAERTIPGFKKEPPR